MEEDLHTRRFRTDFTPRQIYLIQAKGKTVSTIEKQWPEIWPSANKVQLPFTRKTEPSGAGVSLETDIPNRKKAVICESLFTAIPNP